MLKGIGEITLQHKDLDPSPYSKFLEKIRVKVIPESFVNIEVNDSSLLIQGSTEKLSLFAEVVGDFGKDGGGNDHLHIEYYDGHFYLSPKSTSLVILHL